MIIHSPVISGSLTFANGATATLPPGGVYSGSFSGSYQGVSFTGGTFSGIINSTNGVVSGSSQITYSGISSIPVGIVSGSSQITPLLPSGVVSGSSQVNTLLPSGVISGSSQVQFNDINNNPFSSSASNITITAGKKIRSSDENTIIIAENIDVEGNITLLGAVDGVDIAAFKTDFDAFKQFTFVTGSSQVSYPALSNIPAGIVSGSSQVSYPALSNIPAGIVSGSSQVTPLLPSGVVSGSTQILSLVSIDEDTMSSNSDTKVPTQQSVKTYVDTKVSGLVDSAPAALDTLNELAAALGDDANFATTISTTIGGKVSQSLQIISGNGLTGGGNLTTDRTLNVVGTADRISVSADAVDIASTYVGQSTITTLGTIGTGTWQGSVIASAYLDADTAHLTTTQTFSGAKTFSAAVNITDSTASTTKTTGALIVTGGVGVSGALNVGGDVVAYASSDERLKNNIEIISNPIEKVKQLKGVTWEWNENADELQQSLPNVGVIAQDVEKVLPQLVHDRDNGYKGVDYAKLTGLLIEAIKEQQKQIDELKSKLA